MAETLAVIGFMLAAYSIVANDAIQTLGTFLSSNAKRPWWVLWLFACTVLLFVFVYGWVVNDGDVSYGRLSKFPVPAGGITWLHIIPPLVILGLTRFGIPVSTTFLVLTIFAPTNLVSMLTKSLLGYVVSFFLAIGIYFTVTKKLEQRLILTADAPPATTWIVLQWCSTAFLWSQWLMHDLANIFVYLPRHLNTSYFFFATIVMLFLHAVIFARRGGEIQHIVTSKTNTGDIRSATIIDFLYGIILLVFKEYSKMPMSTTWVFLGLLAGRELAVTWLYKMRTLQEARSVVVKDAVKGSLGLGASVALAFGLPPLAAVVFGPSPTPATTDVAETERVELPSSPLGYLAEYHPVEHLSGQVRSIGSDTLELVMADWGKSFSELYPAVEFSMLADGSNMAPAALLAGETELAAMSRPMTDQEVRQFRSKFGYQPVRLRVAMDALGVYVHVDNPIRGLTMAQLAGIFAQLPEDKRANITSWRDVVLPPFPDEPIEMWGRDERSGTRTFFQQVVLGGAPFKNDVATAEDSAAIISDVAESPYAIGYAGMGYVNENVRAVALARTENSQYYKYYVEKLRDDPDLAKRHKPVINGDYPLSRFLYLYVNKAPGKSLDPEVEQFLRYVLSRQGQQTVLDRHFIPLTEPIADDQLKKLAADYAPKWYQED